MYCTAREKQSQTRRPRSTLPGYFFLSLAFHVTLRRCALIAPVSPRITPDSAEPEGAWASCSGTEGLCIDTSVYSCSTPTLFNLCPGEADIRCCPAPDGVMAGSCYTGGTGLCGRTEDCGVTTVTNICPGPLGVTCCPSSICESGTTECGSLCCPDGTICAMENLGGVFQDVCRDDP